jgi:hypothetical protein
MRTIAWRHNTVTGHCLTFCTTLTVTHVFIAAQMNIMYFLPSIPLLILSSLLDEHLDRRFGAPMHGHLSSRFFGAPVSNLLTCLLARKLHASGLRHALVPRCSPRLHVGKCDES